MNQRTRTMVAALLGALAGLAIGCLGMYFFFIQPFLATWERSGYNSAVAEANLTATQLGLLHEGNTAKLAATLEGLLDSHILEASALEEIEPSWRDQQAENAISRVREYRFKYPFPLTDKILQDKVAKALEPKSHAPTAP